MKFGCGACRSLNGTIGGALDDAAAWAEEKAQSAAAAVEAEARAALAEAERAAQQAVAQAIGADAAASSHHSDVSSKLARYVRPPIVTDSTQLALRPDLRAALDAGEAIYAPTLGGGAPKSESSGAGVLFLLGALGAYLYARS